MKSESTKKESEKDHDMITVSQPFAATIIQSRTTGHNSLEIQSKDFYQHQLNKFKPDEKVTVTISNKKPKRTQEQNRYYWGVYLPLISAETGEQNIDRLHGLFSGKFLTSEIVEVLGEKVRIKKSTTELGVGDFCKYIMDIESETGIAAPPTENYDLIALSDGVNLK
jgi:hypothetical protein